WASAPRSTRPSRRSARKTTPIPSTRPCICASARRRSRHCMAGCPTRNSCPSMARISARRARRTRPSWWCPMPMAMMSRMRRQRIRL
ncbi:hypothetical protein LTR94_034025, partial [Friedmanniomyces endolithicus]